MTPRKAKELPDPRVNVVMPRPLHERFEAALHAMKRTKKGETSKAVCEAVEAWLKAQGH